MQEATIEDVAKLSGVSIATVSRTFKHPELVAEKTRKKIKSVAKDLDFSISRSAMILQAGKTYRIALLFNERPSTWFNAHIYEGLNAVLQPAGYDITLQRIVSSDDRHKFFETLPIRRNVDAVIVASINISENDSARLHSMKVPIVGINAVPEDAFNLSIRIDDRQSMRLATQHLISIGHRNIAFIAYQYGQEDIGTLNFTTNFRIQGFKDACEEAGIKPTIINVRRGENVIDNVLTSLFQLQPTPTAICCQQDSLVVPLVPRLEQFGYRVPDDISIISVDDSDFAREMGLTEIRQDPTEMAQTIATRLLAMLEGQEVDVKHQILPTQIVFRNSTRPYRAAAPAMQQR
ncbi:MULTISPECIES: LacI family DNA-binding transcriptional regulator [unclassified Bifidobacterium]|uniref:LacI family DNA-binding transcriptional regulator n=1 Tax=unclassified Bifidobacterium TaxID=2608897 RepID=UPI0023FA2A2D|nr:MULTISPECIES: LacI family DNA-binding transcriptional regulator [unclassified Bifidobacterium]WEV65709.1 LacI family DNA-binding transcriptional regulator [Bifidobacterium sp. ESL0764]WEV75504.1 LacI family DNA-binding transcriptional regulator [Bifidobacterium sp. ESL0800]